MVTEAAQLTAIYKAFIVGCNICFPGLMSFDKSLPGRPTLSYCGENRSIHKLVIGFIICSSSFSMYLLISRFCQSMKCQNIVKNTQFSIFRPGLCQTHRSSVYPDGNQRAWLKQTRIWNTFTDHKSEMLVWLTVSSWLEAVRWSCIDWWSFMGNPQCDSWKETLFYCCFWNDCWVM